MARTCENIGIRDKKPCCNTEIAHQNCIAPPSIIMQSTAAVPMHKQKPIRDFTYQIQSPAIAHHCTRMHIAIDALTRIGISISMHRHRYRHAMHRHRHQHASASASACIGIGIGIGTHAHVVAWKCDMRACV